MVHLPVAEAAITMIPVSNVTTMPHLPVRANLTAAAVALLQVPRIQVVDMVPDMMGDVHTALIITGVAPHHQAATTVTEVHPAVGPLPLLVEMVMDRHHTVEAVAPLTIATVVVMAQILLPVVVEVHTAVLQILTVVMVDLPSLPAQAAAILQDPLAVVMIPVDPLRILLH